MPNALHSIEDPFESTIPNSTWCRTNCTSDSATAFSNRATPPEDASCKAISIPVSTANCGSVFKTAPSAIWETMELRIPIPTGQDRSHLEFESVRRQVVDRRRRCSDILRRFRGLRAGVRFAMGCHRRMDQ